MGQKAPDCYRVQDQQSMAQSDTLPASYIWMDLKVNGPENKLYIGKFKDQFSVEGQDSFEVFQAQVKTWETHKSKLRVICAASLNDDVYRFIDSSDIIERALLFCGNKVRANNLMRDFPKIKKACFSYSEVIKEVKKWQKEGNRSFLFFELQDMERMNKLSINLRALTDPKISEQDGKEHLRKYMERVLKNESLEKFHKFDENYEKLRNNITKTQAGKDSLIKFFRDNLIDNDNVVISEINKLLRCTSNPKKLAYLRLIISDLVNVIKDAFKEHNSMQNTFTAIVSVNEEELKKFGTSVNRFFTFTHFVEARAVESSSMAELKESQILVKIKMPVKKGGVQACNGYLLNKTALLLNLGNFFKVDNYNEGERELNATMVHFDDSKLNLVSKKQDWIQLNQNWITSQHQKYEGQLLALLTHDEQSDKSYIQAKIASYHKQKNISKEQLIFKLLLSRQNWNIKKRKSVQSIEKALNNLNPPTYLHKYMLILSQCQLFFYHRLDVKFRNAVKLMEFIKEKPQTDEIIQKVKLFQFYDRFLADSNIQSRQQLMDIINNKEKELSEEPHSQTYHLLINIKILFFYGMKAYKEALELINRFAFTLSICEGTNSQGFVRLNELKVELMIRQNEELNRQEQLIKKNLRTSKIEVQSLKKPNEIYSIDTSKLNFALFN